MMRVWLLDVYSETKSHLNGTFEPYFSNLIREFDGQGLESIPIPQEFQLILTDFMNTSGNQNRERMDHLQRIEEKINMPQPKGVYYFNPEGKEMYQYAKKYLTPKFKEALQAGISVVVIAGKLYGSDEGYHNYLWFLELYKTLNVVDSRPGAGPASISCVSSDRAVQELYEKYQHHLTWEVAFKNLVEEERRLSPLRIAFGRGNVELPTFQPLFVNVKKDPVAFSLKVGKGELVVLPNIEDIETRGRYIAYILDEFLPQFRPAWFPDRWAGSYTPAVLVEMAFTLQAEKQKLLRMIKEKESQLEGRKQVMQSYIDLLTQADVRLEDGVKRAFREVFGLSIMDLDSKRNHERKPRLFDLIAPLEGKQFAIEIKGGQRSLKKEMLAKTEENVKIYLQDYASESLDGIVIIINDQISKAPKDREQFAPNLLDLAEDRGITVLSTQVLMELMAMYLSGDITHSDLVAIFSKPGLAQVPRR